MKQKWNRFAALGCAALLLFSLAGCSTKIADTEITEIYQEAVKNSTAADLYFWKETTIDGKESTYREVNVYAEQNKNYEPIRDDQGNYAKPALHVLEKKNQKDVVERYCGPSNGTAGEKNYYFERSASQDAGTSWKWSGKEMTNQAYYQTEQFQKQYELDSVIAELNILSLQDMDFSVKSGQAQKKGKTVTLDFKVKDEYLQKYEQEHGTPSLFAGTKRVSIEIAYNRITHIITYVDEQLGGGMSSETEKYKLEVVYLGPKVKMPSYDELNK